MTPQRYAEITRLCQAALELNASQRAAFLTQACAGDDELRAEIEALLAADAEENSFIDAPALEVAARIFAHEQPALTGQQLGNYQILRQLGAGGMGEVYLAEDTRLKRKVALKLLPAAFTQDTERVRRFAQEAQAASALNHPNILTIYDFGETRATGRPLHYIAAEYVEGQTLRQLLQRGPLPVEQVSAIAAQLADALSAAHNAGIIHRDIKPENIMRRPDGYVKVLDFGLAKLTEKQNSQSAIPNPQSLTEPGRVMGTISYMSPEQALGRDVDARTDIFSLGVVLYELLTGVQPFKRDSEAATYDAILNRTPPALTQANLPPELAAIIERALEKDRELRYQTAADVRAALKRLQRDSASHSAAVASPSRAPTRRKWAVAAAVFALTLAGGAYLWRNWQPARSQPNAARSATVTALPRTASFAQITEQTGMEYFPTLAPDGGTLVYASRAAGNWDLWQQTVGQRDAVNLTSDSPADDTQPAFAPDGKQLAFRSARAGGGLFVMNLATRAVRKINSEGFNPTWSPDGAEVAYGTASITNVEARAASQLWAVRLATGARRLIVSQDSAQPAWSPDGKHLAFFGIQANGQLDLMTIAASGGAPVKLTTDAATDWNPCWAADGKSLYFTSDRGGNTNVWRIAVDAETGQPLGAPEPFTTPATDTYHLSVSRDGRQIAYVQRNKQRNIYTLGFDPASGTVRGTPRALTRGTGSATHPAVSPDGQWLAYTTAGNPQTDLYVMRVDGTGVRRLTNDAARDHLPRWSPDGKRLAFMSDREGKNECWAIAADGSGPPEQLTFVGASKAVFPSWSPDGRWLAYTVLRQGSYLIDAHRSWNQQTPQPLLLDGQLASSLSVFEWSPDGQKLVCLQQGADSQHPNTAVYWLAPPAAAPRLQPLAEDTEYPAWLSDSQRLLVLGANRLLLADLRTNATRVLFRFDENEIAEYLALAPDDRTLYYSRSTIEADIWLLKL